MGDKTSAASGQSVETQGSKKGRLEVPYGNPYSKDKQTQMTRDKVKQGLAELMALVKDGAGACVDKATVIEHATKLDKQADKIGEALVKDNVFIEEVRHHHNRISDLCDNTRAYGHEQMVNDLKRAAAIRVNVMTIVTGKPPEFELDQEEQDELKSVRAMLRRKFGAKPRPAEETEEKGWVDQSAMTGDPTKVKAKTKLSESGLMGEEMTEGEFNDFFRAQTAPAGNWAAMMVEQHMGPSE